MASAAPCLPHIDQLNASQDSSFVEAITTLFEAAPPLANALLAARPFLSYSELLNKARFIISELSDADRRIVVNAHPRIGASKATLSALSLKEQGYTDPTNATQPSTVNANPETNDDQVNERLAQLNQAYEAKFGFCFVVFVAGRPRSEIVSVIETRMNNSPKQELETGLESMLLIAHDRLKKLQGN
ncbi:hypothetical protein BSLG_010342 [Batrachochytrium salamandrivorans]|nr:hypothetical protein BSLG_010342 [Batrachochytrium salamandrivorans]